MTGPLVGITVLQPPSGTIVCPGQPRPHQLTITAFPDDSGATASVTIGLDVQEPTPDSAWYWLACLPVPNLNSAAPG